MICRVLGCLATFLDWTGVLTTEFDKMRGTLHLLRCVIRKYRETLFQINDKGRLAPLTCHEYGTLDILKLLNNSNKNSSGDEIANVNFLRRYGTYVLQNTKKREPTSFNQLDDS